MLPSGRGARTLLRATMAHGCRGRHVTTITVGPARCAGPPSVRAARRDRALRRGHEGYRREDRRRGRWWRRRGRRWRRRYGRRGPGRRGWRGRGWRGWRKRLARERRRGVADDGGRCRRDRRSRPGRARSSRRGWGPPCRQRGSGPAFMRSFERSFVWCVKPKCDAHVGAMRVRCTTSWRNVILCLAGAPAARGERDRVAVGEAGIGPVALAIHRMTCASSSGGPAALAHVFCAVR